jgi:hypothetical protein
MFLMLRMMLIWVPLIKWSGLKYLDYIDKNRDVLIDGETTTIPTTFHYVGEGFNETNTSLSAISKEYLFGIISTRSRK